jgi:GrpB-like predicted nucleotidyltransferase (UPF0157 family)
MQKPLETMTNEELWVLFPIILEQHNPLWELNYQEEAKQIINAVKKANIVRISHIGSTAVPGLVAKPTIDILLEVDKGIDTAFLISAIKSIGYIYTPQPNRPAPHMMFQKGYTPTGFEGQAYHIHVRYPGDWDELHFRDYLKSHPEAIQEYAVLKSRLQKQYEHNRDAYTDAKTEFVQRITQKARAEGI